MSFLQRRKDNTTPGSAPRVAVIRGLALDVIVEGKITSEEPMKEVIETLVDLKNFPHLVLRVSASDNDLEGRIAFSHGGYILGGRINNSDESGYPAIHKLLSIKSGNYAILDPGRQQIGDINQTLWILSERVKERLPDLPTSPAGLFDADPEHALAREQASGGPDGSSALSLPGIAELAHGLVNQPAQQEVAVKSTIHDIKGRARSFNPSAWLFIQSTLIVLFCLVVLAGLVTMWSFHGLLLKPPEKNSIEKITHPANSERTDKTRHLENQKKSRGRS